MVECGGLENRFPITRDGGSNPSSSAMYYVYILQSRRDNGYYIGYTADLKQRLKEHNS